MTRAPETKTSVKRRRSSVSSMDLAFSSGRHDLQPAYPNLTSPSTDSMHDSVGMSPSSIWSFAVPENPLLPALDSEADYAAEFDRAFSQFSQNLNRNWNNLNTSGHTTHTGSLNSPGKNSPGRGGAYGSSNHMTSSPMAGLLDTMSPDALTIPIPFSAETQASSRSLAAAIFKPHNPSHKAASLLNEQEASAFTDFLGRVINDSDLEKSVLRHGIENEHERESESENENENGVSIPGLSTGGGSQSSRFMNPEAAMDTVVIRQEHEIKQEYQLNQYQHQEEQQDPQHVYRGEEKRIKHISSEKRRRDVCRQLVEELCIIVPKLRTPVQQTYRGRSLKATSRKKSSVLALAREYIEELVGENRALRQYLMDNGQDVEDIEVAT